MSFLTKAICLKTLKALDGMKFIFKLKCYLN